MAMHRFSPMNDSTMYCTGYAEVRHHWHGLLLLLAGCASGCAISAPQHQLAMRTLTQATFCRENTSQARIITDVGSYRTAWRTAQGNVIAEDRTPPAIDFTRERVIAIYMGRQNTAGYHVRPATTATLHADGTLEIPVEWTEPGPDTLQAQVITSPCVLVAVTAGDFRTVRVVDAQGRVPIGK
jgi:PrcB C-terminal